MKLVLEWSTGEYDDYCWHCVPFEWNSVEDLDALIDEKKRAHEAAHAKKKEYQKTSAKGNWTEWLKGLEAIEAEYPKPIVDDYGHELDVAMFWCSYNGWASDLEIYTINEWFKK